MSAFPSLALLLFAYMSAWFVVSLVRKRNDVADVAWGLGFVVMAWAALVLSKDVSARGVLVNILVSIWGLRLAWHIHARNRTRSEDYRYLAWRKAWGRSFVVRSYLQVFLLQGLLLFMIVQPVLAIHANPAVPLGWLDLLGGAVWIVGFFFEVVGDAQLAQFRKEPAHRGKLMQSGLWAYTRHPNYFGEVTLWWGIWLLALAVPHSGFSIIGPLTITTLIVFISGIPMLEKNMAEHPDFAEYKRRVSVFFPFPATRHAREEHRR